MQIPRDGRSTNQQINERTYERKNENYIPLGINARGIISFVETGKNAEYSIWGARKSYLSLKLFFVYTGTPDTRDVQK